MRSSGLYCNFERIWRAGWQDESAGVCSAIKVGEKQKEIPMNKKGKECGDGDKDKSTDKCG